MIDFYKNAIGPRYIITAFILLFLTGCAPPPYPKIAKKCPKNSVPVTGYAQALVADTRLQNAKITWLERHREYYTNQYGQFNFCAKPNQRMTLLIEKNSAFPSKNYYPTQTSSVFVDKNGLSGKYHEVTFQVPRRVTFKALQSLMWLERHASMNKNACHVVLTVTNYHKTLADDPQGIQGAKVILWHRGKHFILTNKPYYFGIILKKTNPFTPGHDVSSLDGGVLIFNLPPSLSWYKISAIKKGVKFSSAYFWCRPNAFINLSPPHSPSRLMK